jgi:hypothetical protein
MLSGSSKAAGEDARWTAAETAALLKTRIAALTLLFSG